MSRQAKSHQRSLLRPPLCLERLSLTADGRIAYERKYQSAGASHIVMTPTEFLARLSALVFAPRHPILRYHGAFAANHKLRSRIVPKSHAGAAAPPAESCPSAKAPPPPIVPAPRRVRVEDSVAAAAGAGTDTSSATAPVSSAPKSTHRRVPRTAVGAINKPLDWATLLKRVWSIDALACPCGGRLRFIAVITEPEPVTEILLAMGLDSKPPARAGPRHAELPWECCEA
jgi:hypothetical protein